MKPHTYGKTTLRKMSPLQRIVANEVNALEATARRLRVVVDRLGEVEADAAAQRQDRAELIQFSAAYQEAATAVGCVAHGARPTWSADGHQVCAIGFPGLHLVEDDRG